jgi:hypothetical protein
MRKCRVSVRDVDGLTHAVEVHAATLFEAAASAIAIFRQEAWSADALTPHAVVRVEVQLPSILHEVPLAALDRWSRSPTVSPKDLLVKQRNRRNPAQ